MSTDAPRLRLGPRPWTVVVVVAVVLGAMAASFLAGLALREPDAAAYDNGLRSLTTTGVVETRTMPVPTALGTVGGGAPVEVRGSAPAGAASAQITAAPLGPGAAVVDGALLFAVAESPVFALALDGPHYRDLVRGDEGADVLALNGALFRLGYAADPEEDAFDGDTADSLAAFYDDRGYRAPRGPDVVAAPVAVAPSTVTPSTATPSTASPLPAVASPGARGGRLPFADVVDLDRSDFTVGTAPTLYSVVPSEGAVMTWTVPIDRVVARVDAATVDSLATGSAVTIVQPASGARVAGVLESVGPFAPAVDDAPPGYDVTVLVAEGDRAALAAGSSVSLTFGERGAERIGVPATALRQDGATTFVLVQEVGGPRRVDVDVRAVADGWALLDGEPALAVGDTVVIG